MDLKPGTRLRSITSEAEVIVVRPPSQAPAIACGGAPLVLVGDPAPSAAPASGLEEPTLLGKRYVDADTGIELLCTKGGSGTLTCDGRVMPLKDAKPLPSSD